MSRAVPASPLEQYPRLYARVEGMTQEEARMVVITIIKFVSPYNVLLNLLMRSLRTMPTLLREGYRGYKSARTRVIEAIQIRDWVSTSVILHPVLMLRQQVERSLQKHRAIFRRGTRVV